MCDQSRKKPWICPVCDRRGDFDSLAVDEYFQRVLDNAAPGVTEIRYNMEGVRLGVIRLIQTLTD